METRKKNHPEQASSSVPKVKEQTDVKNTNSVMTSPTIRVGNPLSMVGKMKKIAMWFSTTSRMSWLQVWKQMHSWLSLHTWTCYGERKPSARSKRRYSRSSCHSERKKVQGCVSQNSDPMNSVLRKAGELGLHARRDTPWNSQDALGTKLKFG